MVIVFSGSAYNKSSWINIENMDINSQHVT